MDGPGLLNTHETGSIPVRGAKKKEYMGKVLLAFIIVMFGLCCIRDTYDKYMREKTIISLKETNNKHIEMINKLNKQAEELLNTAADNAELAHACCVGMCNMNKTKSNELLKNNPYQGKVTNCSMFKAP